MAHTDTQPRTQAELDAYIDSLGRPRRNTFNGMFPLHEDMELDDDQIRIVLDYLQEVDFHLPGATPEEFLVVRWARYTGFQFIQEPLEAYAVGLRCTHPGMEDQHTFIRMSWAQLMGRPDAERLPVNEPVLASDMMTLARYRDTRTGPSRTGVDSYAGEEVPGADFDLKLLHGALEDLLSQQASGKGREINTWWTPALNWGAAMAGRYPRLKYFESKGRLGERQLARLHDFERRANQAASVLRELGVALPERVAQDSLRQAAKAERGSFLPRLRIRNPQPLTEVGQDTEAGADDQRPYTDPQSDADFPTADDPTGVSSTDGNRQAADS
ncbi:hypothetical protein [Arthrobacter echini]|uniref:hypothetical protein n=1 Tax=Arthrobacter echini TaxID=1529066 RepID=UPI001B3B7269|nr:hypothetical protein [Arthrobacter echini]